MFVIGVNNKYDKYDTITKKFGPDYFQRIL